MTHAGVTVGADGWDEKYGRPTATRLRPDELAALDRAARATRRSRSSEIARYVREGLDREGWVKADAAGGEK